MTGSPYGGAVISARAFFIFSFCCYEERTIPQGLGERQRDREMGRHFPIFILFFFSDDKRTITRYDRIG